MRTKKPVLLLVALLVVTLAAALCCVLVIAETTPQSTESSISDDVVSKLNDWARDHMSHSHRLKIHSSRSVNAALDIAESETVLVVGRSEWIDERLSAERHHRDRIAELLRPLNLPSSSSSSMSSAAISRDGTLSQLSAAAIVAFELLFEVASPSSRWRSYIDALPKDAGLPLSYSSQVLDQFKGSPVYDNTIKTKATLAAQWRAIRPLYKELTNLDLEYEDWRWAMSIVISRAFAFRSGWALIPIADMLDHSATPEVSYTLTNDRLTLTATRAIKEDELIHGSYGTGSNAHFLQQFGFVLEDNKDDAVVLNINSATCPFERFFPNQAKFKQSDLEDLFDEHSSGGVLAFTITSNTKSIDPLFAFARAITRGDSKMRRAGEIGAYSSTLEADIQEIQQLKNSENFSSISNSNHRSNIINNGNSNSSNLVSYYRLTLLISEKQILTTHLKELEERAARWELRDKRPRRTRPTPPPPPTKQEL